MLHKFCARDHKLTASATLLCLVHQYEQADSMERIEAAADGCTTLYHQASYIGWVTAMIRGLKLLLQEHILVPFQGGTSTVQMPCMHAVCLIAASLNGLRRWISALTLPAQ